MKVVDFFQIYRTIKAMITSLPPQDQIGAPTDMPPHADPRYGDAAPPEAKKIFRNKLMIAFGIVGFLLFTVGQFYPKDDSTKTDHKTAADRSSSGEPQSPNDKTQVDVAPTPMLTPTVATQFISWWVPLAMDYNAISGGANHNKAFGWMTDGAAKQFKQCFWSPAIASGVAQGTLAAAFQPATVQAEAVNPDGSVVVGLTGSLVMQDATTPAVTQPIVVDFLVKKGNGGFRIAGLYNRTGR